ncbi:hypothetical protein WJX72_008853 [[Myrmecia] bisecta]|uniref:ABC transporter domain-containing protein n=1 Tax=[Myrmecia] bisecta TaxID=41462 RepID=A0AAW1P325_9CHLO
MQSNHRASCELQTGAADHDALALHRARRLSGFSACCPSERRAPQRRVCTAALNPRRGLHRRAPTPEPVFASDPEPEPQRPQLAEPSLSAVSPREPPGEVLIELRNVHKAFGSKPILRGANIKIRRGEAVGIIGGSGTGKSTTLRLMAGLLEPDQGEVLIHGQVRKGLLSDDPMLADQLAIGMVFQNGALFDSLTVGENVGFLLYEHTKLPKERIEALVAGSLSAVGLSGVQALYPAELSGGMRKRVALARAIIKDDQHRNAEQVIMYDEPTAGLDPVASTVVEDLIRSLHVGDTSSNGTGSQQGISAYIVVTHQHSTIRRAVDRLIFLHEGQVVWEGTTEEFDTTQEPIVRQFASGSLAGPIVYL